MTQQVTGNKKGICRDKHLVLYRSVQSVNSNPETSITLSTNWDLNKNILKKEWHSNIENTSTIFPKLDTK